MLFILQSTKDPIIVVGPVHNTFGKEVLLNLDIAAQLSLRHGSWASEQMYVQK